MKILMVNQNWLRAEFEAAGHSVFSVSLSNEGCDIQFPAGGIDIEEILRALPSGFSPDRVLYWDDSTVSWVSGLEQLDVPKLFYSVDVHHHHTWHPQFSATFDRVLVAQKDYVPAFYGYSPEAQWLPLWATQAPFPEQPRDLNTVFVGTLNDTIHPKRREFFEAVMRLTRVDVLQGDYRGIYARAKIVLNQVVSGDLNFRVFEALNSGALLITPRIGNGLLDLFTDGEDLVCYEDGNANDAAAKVEQYLRDETLRQKVAAQGAASVRTNHSCQARAAELIQILQSLEIAQKPQRMFGAAFAYLVAYLTCKHQQIAWGRSLLKPARGALLKYGPLQNGDEVGTAVLLANFTTEEEGQGAARTYLVQQLAASPGCRALELALIQKELEMGHREEALSRAKRISADPEQLCQGVVEALRLELARV